MRSKMRLLCRVGKDALSVLVYIQKAKMRRGTDAQTVQFIANQFFSSVLGKVPNDLRMLSSSWLGQG